MNITMTLGGVALLIESASDLREITKPNETTNQTIGGKIFTDFAPYSRGWEVKWPKLSKDDYDDIRAVFDLQYSSGNYPELVIPFYDIDVVAKLTLNDKDIRFDGECIRGFSIILQEQDAIDLS